MSTNYQTRIVVGFEAAEFKELFLDSRDKNINPEGTVIASAEELGYDNYDGIYGISVEDSDYYFEIDSTLMQKIELTRERIRRDTGKTGKVFSVLFSY